jgi:hypothetical protein
MRRKRHNEQTKPEREEEEEEEEEAKLLVNNSNCKGDSSHKDTFNTNPLISSNHTKLER